jgi:hypothetical protein
MEGVAATHVPNKHVKSIDSKNQVSTRCRQLQAESFGKKNWNLIEK